MQITRLPAKCIFLGNTLKKALLIAGLASALAAAGGPAVAQQTLYWSGTTGTSAPLWSTLAAWSTLPGSLLQPTAFPGAADTAVFSLSSLTTPQNVYLGGNQSALGLTFSSTAATTLRSGTGSPAANSLTLGTGGITVALGAGAVAIGTGSSDNVNVVLGGSQSWTVAGGGRLAVGGSVAGSASTGGAQTLTIAGNGATTITGVVSNGAGGGVFNLTKTGSGVLRLANTGNTYTGTTTISQGTVVVSGSGGLGQGSSTVTVGGLANLYLDGSQTPIALSRNLSMAGDQGSLLSNGLNTITGSISRTGGTSWIASVNDTLTLSGPLALVSGTTFLGGLPDSGNIVVSGSLSGAGALIKQGYGTLFLDPSNSSAFSGAITIRNSNSVLIGNAFSSVRITKNGVIGTNGTIRQETQLNGGYSLLEVRMDSPLLQTTTGSNANMTTNGSLNSGGVRLFVDHGVGSTTTGGTLTLGTQDGSQRFASRNGYGFTLGYLVGSDNRLFTFDLSGQLTVTGSNNSVVRVDAVGPTLFTGNLVGSANTLTKNSAGLLTIQSTGATLGGAVTINEGAVAVTDFRSLGNVSTGTIALGSGTGAVQLIIGTSVAPGSAANLTSQRRINIGSTTGNAAIYASQSGANPVLIANIATTGAGTKTLILGGTSTADNLISGTIADNGGTTSLRKTGPGTWGLSGSNTFTGTASILAGTLKLNATAGTSNVLANAVGITFNADSTVGSAGGTLTFNGFLNTQTSETVGALTPTAGAGNVVVTNNGGASTTLTFASLGARGTGATLNYAPGSAAGIAFTTAPTVTNGIIAAASGSAAFQTFRGTDWATYASGSVAAATYTPLPASAATSTVNYSLSADTTVSAAMSVNTLKLIGAGTPPTLTLGGTLTLTAKGLLFDNSSGAATISGSQLGAAGDELVVYTGGTAAANALTINAAIGSGTASLTKSGPGLLVIGGSNAFTGNTIINEGTVRLSGSTATLGAITAAANTTTLRQGATLDINAAGPSQTVTIGALAGTGTITNSGGGAGTAGTLSIGQGTTTTADGTFTGILQNGSGVLNVTKNGTGNQSLLGLSTYTGVTRINSGTVTVDVLANGSVASGIGQSGSAAGNLVFNGTSTLAYAGNNRLTTADLAVAVAQTARTDRLFTIEGTGTTTIASNVGLSNALVWTNPGAIAHSGSAARTITLSGSSTGDNAFAPQITDSGAGANITSVRKEGAGIWLLTGTNNTYTGATTIAEGSLGFLGGLPANSPLQVGVTGSTGTLLMSGTLSRTVVSSPVSGTNTITLGGATSGNAGFGAVGTKLVVAFQQSGTLQQLVWGTNGFLSSSGNLVLGASTALAEVEFQNPINLNNATRTISLVKNPFTAADTATLSGVISGSGGLVITGTGRLVLAADNTYSGATQFNSASDSILVVRSFGNSTYGSAASSLGASGTSSANALTLGNGSQLQYVGPGEETDRMIRLTGGFTRIDAMGSGPLVLQNIVNTTTGNTLFLGGENFSDNVISANLSGLTLNVSNVNTNEKSPFDRTTGGPATTRWILSGSNSLTGTQIANYSALGFGSDAAGNIGTLRAAANLFAVGGDRRLAFTLEWPIDLGQAAPTTFSGEYGITLTSPVRILGIQNGVGLQIMNSIVAGKTLTLEGGITDGGTKGPAFFDGSGDTVVSGNITGATALTKQGAGRLTLSGSNVYSGNTTISAGILSISSTAALPGWNVAGRYPVAAGAALVVGNGVSDADFTTIRVTGSTGFAANSMLGFDTGTTAAFERIYSGSSISDPAVNNPLGLMKIGSGTLTLNVANTYTGTTTINEGVLRLGVAGALPSASAIAVSSNAALDVGVNSTTSGAVTVSGTSSSIFGSGTLTAGSYTFSNTSGTSSVTTVLAGNAATFTKSGAGTTVLSGLNTYQGTTTVGNGILQFNSLASGTNAQSLGGGTLVNLGVAGTSAGEIDYSNATSGTLAKNITALGSGRNRIRNSGGGTLTLSGTLTKDGTILELASGTFTVSGRITGATAGTSDLFINNAAVTLSNANNDYNGPTYVYGGGSLTLGASNVIPNNSALILGGTGTDTGTGRINTSLFSDTIASLTTSSLGATIGIDVNGSTAGGLTTTGGLTFGAGTDTLALSLTNPSLGRYTLLSYATRSGTFDSVTGNGNYNVVYGAESNSTIDLQLKANQGSTFTLNPAASRVLVGGSTQLSGLFANTSPVNAAALTWSGSSTGTLSATGITSSLGSSIAAGSTSSITAWLAAGSTPGTQTWSITNTDNNAITTVSTATGSISVVNQRTFSVSNSGTINLGNFLRTAAVTGSTTISSIGLNATTANASLGSFGGGPTGFSLTTLASTDFLGTSGTQSALYTLSGSAASAGAISGNFTSTVTAELASIDPVSVALVGTAYDPATAVLAAGGSAVGNAWTISLGEFNQGSGTSTPWNFAISNLLVSNLYTADLVLESFSTTLNSNAIFMSLSGTSFQPPLVAGGTNPFTAWMSLANTGTFTNTYNLTFASAKGGQSLGGSQNVTMTVTGVIVVPEPGTLALAAAGIGMALVTWARRRRAA